MNGHDFLLLLNISFNKKKIQKIFIEGVKWNYIKISLLKKAA